VPPNFVTGIRSVAKEFAGDLIEEARRVQGEWEVKGAGDHSMIPLKATQPDPRGPLRPEHLIEAWRRYKQNNAGAVGIHGLWHEQQGDGVRRFARRSGKTLFR
jgi:transcription initiation factor TFIID subunit 11